MVEKRLILIAFAASACFGQRLEVGAKVGLPVTDAFQTGSFFTIDFGESATSSTRRYTAGPTIGLRLPRGLSLEFDALYKRLGFDDLLKSTGILFVHTRTTANSWEFPILGKVRFLHLPILSPYVAGGVSFRHISGVSSISEQFIGFFPNDLTRSTSSSSTILNNRSSHGGVVGVGAEARAAFLRISPEVRYTRWGADRNLDPQLHSNQNQVEVLLGITF